MQKKKSWELVSNYGLKIKEVWSNLSKKYELGLKIGGINAIPNFSFNSKNHLKYKTYISQEMLKNKFLASNIVYVSTSHDNNILLKYKNNIEKIFKEIKNCEEGKNIDNLLETKVSQNTFKRLN